MNSVRGLVFSLARVSIEFNTAFLVSSGAADDVRDAVCVADANGLPTIPGSAITGVLRNSFPAEDARRYFGYQDEKLGQSSNVEVSWAQVHNGNNIPVPFRAPAGGAADPVLDFLRAGVVRHHARIGVRGTVAERGKFDELAVPAGARFTFELLVHELPELAADGGSAPVRDAMIARLRSAFLRFGGSSRRGLGVFTVIGVRKDRFDLNELADRRRFHSVPRDLSIPLPQGALVSQHSSEYADDGEARWIRASLELVPEDFWLFGGGEPELPEHSRNGRTYDMLPVTEARVSWSPDGKGSVTSPQYRIPAAGIKGALRHRLGYHGRRLARQFAKDCGSSEQWLEGSNLQENEDVVWWFGDKSNRQDKDQDSGSAGRVLIADGWLVGPKTGSLDHVSLDRFTQGPIDGALFDERPLYRGNLSVDLAIDTDFKKKGEPPHAREAFRKTISDLCCGKLAIGAGAARGHGFCSGSVTWSDHGTWIGGAQCETR